MGSSNIERSLSIAQCSIRADICPSSWRDYHPVHMANDNLSLQTSLTGRSTVVYYQTMNYGRQERMLYTTLVGSPNYALPLIFIIRKVLITWGIQGAPSRFSSLHFHLSGSIPGPSQNSYQKFQSYCRIQLICSGRTIPPLASGLPVPQLPTWLWSNDSPVCAAFLRQVYGILLLLSEAQICGSSS